MNRYFGEPWPSGICEDGIQVETPVGDWCFWCTELIDEHDRGSFIYSHTETRWQPIHRECSLRSVIGGIGHLEDHDRWCLVEHDPDGGRSARQSALEVWDWVQMHGHPAGA